MIHIKPYYFLLIAFGAVAGTIHSCDRSEPENDTVYQELKEGFAEIPLEAKPKGMWCWINGNFDKEGITEEIKAVAANGMGGLDIWDAPPVTDFNGVVPRGPGYPSEAFMVGMKHANQEALKAGINLGFIYNQSVSYRDPENEVKVLLKTESTVMGGNSSVIHLPVPEVIYGKRNKASLVEKDSLGQQAHYWDMAVLAFPVGRDTAYIDTTQIIDLSGRLNNENFLTWEVPEGTWKIIRFTAVNSGQTGLTPTPSTLKPALDFLDADATEIHLRYLLNWMKDGLGDLEHSALQYICSDSYEFTGIKWTEKYPEYFREEYNYRVRKFLPALFGYVINAKETTTRFLSDYNNLVSELTIENHYKRCASIAEEFGIGFVSEAAGPGYPLHDVPFESLKACGVLTYPRGEFWHNRHQREGIPREHVQIIKGPASAAHIYDQKIVEAESFTSVWLWQESLNDLKPSADRFFTEGLNRIAFHTFPHTPKFAGKPGFVYGFGTQISETIPWWEKSKPFMEYLGRCSFMLQQGNFVGDILYFYGDSAPNFVPSKLTDPLNLEGFDYDYINNEVLISKLTVENGILQLPHGQKYEILILPEKKAIELETLKKIGELIYNGAWVIGPKPERSYSLSAVYKDADIQQLASEIWGACDGIMVKEADYGKGKVFWNISPAEVLAKKQVPSDVLSNHEHIQYIHRNHSGTDIYFISNSSDKRVTTDILFRIKGKQPECWDPVTKTITDIPVFTEDSYGTLLPVALEPNGSCFIVFSKPAKKHFDKILAGNRQVFPYAGQNLPFFKYNKKGIPDFFTPYDITLKNSSDALKLSGFQELKSYQLDQNWNIELTDPWGKQFKFKLDTLLPLNMYNDDLVKFFSGKATYALTFEVVRDTIFKKYILSFDPPGDVAEILLNKKQLGIVWTNPFEVDLTDDLINGSNTLEIEVATNWANILCGEARKPVDQQRYNTNISKLPNGWNTPFEQIPDKDVPLQRTGIWNLRLTGFK